MIGHLLKLCAGKLKQQVFRTGGVRRDVRQVDFGFHHAAEFDLGFFRRLAQALKCLAVAAQVNTLFAFELISRPVYNHFIPIVAAQMGVAVGSFHFHHAAANFQQADIEGAAAQVKDQDSLVFFLVQPVCQRGCRGFVDNAQHL